MSNSFSWVRAGHSAAILLFSIPALWGAESRPLTVTVMTRNMDAGTDMNLILGATDEASFVQGVAATLAEIKASGFAERAARLAQEIAAAKPDVIALQEVTLWRTGAIMQPPATDVLYDQLALLQAELAKQKLSYGIVAIQSLMDAEAPVPTEGIDLRITDRDVILARTDLPQSQFDVTNAQAHRYQAMFHFGSALLGQIDVPRGWLSVDVTVAKSTFRFVNTHLESVYPGVPEGAQVQLAQTDELLTAIASPEIPLVLAGDFNANAEPGADYTGAVGRILGAQFSDAWRSAHPYDAPAHTWPLFGEDQASGPCSPTERIDLIFTAGRRLVFGRDPNVLSAERIGATAPWTSDHAGVVATIRLK